MKRLNVMWRASVQTAAIVLAICWLGGTAVATKGSFNDGNAEGATVDKIDITKFAHDDTDNAISYELEFAQPWNHNQLKEIVWTIDFTPDNGSASEDACIEITPPPVGTPHPLGAVVDECIDSIADDVDVVHADGATTLTVTYPRAALDQANNDKPVTEYAYRVVATDNDAGADQSNDFAPDVGENRVTHRISAGASADAPSPTPTATTDPEDALGDDADEDADDDDSDSDDSSDDTEVLAAAAEPRLPDTGPEAVDPPASSGARTIAAAGGALLGVGVLLRLIARRSR